VLFFYGWTVLLAGYAVALRFIQYSDHHGNLRLWGMVLVVALGLIVAAASIYLIYVLEILKLGRLRQSMARRTAVDDGAEAGASGHVVEREQAATGARRDAG
jgi:UDP-GlcNAc:undecaprenyl-phosphate GlcNAc-1-phosphate transferase